MVRTFNINLHRRLYGLSHNIKLYLCVCVFRNVAVLASPMRWCQARAWHFTVAWHLSEPSSVNTVADDMYSFYWLMLTDRTVAELFVAWSNTQIDWYYIWFWFFLILHSYDSPWGYRKAFYIGAVGILSSIHDIMCHVFCYFVSMGDLGEKNRLTFVTLWLWFAKAITWYHS